MDPSESTRHGPAHMGGDKHPDLNAQLDDVRNAGMRVTNQFKGMWRTAIQYIWSEQLRNINVKKNWLYIVVNRIYPLLFQNIAKLAKNNPKILAHPWDQQKENIDKYVENWAGHLQYKWNSPYQLNMRFKLIKGLLDAGVFGYMVGKTIWDDKVRWITGDKKWHEDVKHTFVHPTCFWADPSAESMEDAQNCGSFRRVALEWAQARWPEFKDEIENETYTSSDPRYTEGEFIIYENQKADTVDKNKKVFSKLVGLILRYGFGKGRGDAQDNEQRYVTIEEIYWKDAATEHVEIKDNVGVDKLLADGTVVKEKTNGLILDAKTNKPLEEWPTELTNEYDEPRFPFGRFILRIGRTILNPKEEEQKYTESRWPFEIMPYHILPHMWQGGNAVEASRLNNDMLNLTVSAMVNQVMRTADPTKLVEAGALARDRNGKIRSTNDDITGLGRIVIAAKGKIKSIMNMVYPPLDPSVVQLAEILKKDLDDQQFMPPVARGHSEKKGKISATEAAKLDVNAHDYTAMQAIFLDVWIDNTATLIAELCQRHYKPGRLMRVLDKDGQGSIKLTKQALDVRFDVNIEPGSTLPFDEEKKQNETLKAYELLKELIPNPMLEEALQVLNISNRQEILARHQGLMLFKKFIMLGQMASQVPPEQLQALVKGMPVLQPVLELLMQAGQLAPQTGMVPKQNQQKKGAA